MCCCAARCFGSIRNYGHGFGGEEHLAMIQRYLSGLGMIFSLLLVGCSQNSPNELTVAQPVQAAPAKATASAETMFVASGPLIVEHQVDVAALREGVVGKILAVPGTQVKQGQLLATFDDRQLSADVEAARAKTHSFEADLKNWQAETKVLESDYERAKKLWDAQIIAKEQLDHARYKFESDQWDVQRAEHLLVNARQTEKSLELELEKTRITAPFDGVVARRYIREGQNVTKGDRLFWVTAEAPLRVRFTLPERFVGHVKRGTQLTLTTPELSEQRRTVRIIEVSPVVDPSSATIEVMAELVGNSGQLRPGMSANILVTNQQ
jgi:membrane fusion protein (multidrug efflux system)